MNNNFMELNERIFFEQLKKKLTKWVFNEPCRKKLKKAEHAQGYNARKVMSEVYASLVLQCTVSGR